ncbi:MAG: tRNA (adenosine(37)-N6)-dimethylallyltransferase MiaA [Clostridia bacterium]|nr:tRNA (adenosine(37)-N6)-dimethylallyltransferase MiaA [Clostridia bacterium]
MQKVIAIVGPTASGKTGLSVAIAKHFGGEVVSVDSMQIYREMNIGTAKPSLAERDGVPHHLMGHISVEQTYNVAAYIQDAHHVLADLRDRKCLPILCGGTGLYMDHLLNETDFFDIPQNDSVRKKYQILAGQQGNDALYRLLEECDPVLAAKLHPNDSKRVIRGLEVFEVTGRRLSEFQKESHRESPFEVLWLGLNFRNRQALYDRINLRVDLMVENGLLDEIRGLMRGYKLSSTARAAIGYKEIIDAIESNGSVDDAVELVKQKSRNYAKRQLTWFGRNKNIQWLYRDEMSDEELVESASAYVTDFLKGGNE